jgi:hypothetical protein
MLRARIPFTPHLQRKEPALPRLRGCRRAVRAIAWLGGKGRPHLLPRARGRGTRGRERRDERERHGHREHAWLRQEARDDCMSEVVLQAYGERV